MNGTDWNVSERNPSGCWLISVYNVIIISVGFDSWGKIPSGLYHQNGYAVGNVDQCRGFSWEHIRGQHCTFFGAFPSDMEVLVSGLCVPHFCDPDAAQALYGDYLNTQGIMLVPFIEQEMLCIRDEEFKYDGAMITAM